MIPLVYFLKTSCVYSWPLSCVECTDRQRRIARNNCER